jgi:putative Holliday junction resolvase
MSRVLGIDFGYKRIGIAISDPSRLIAQALTTLHRKGSLAPILLEIIHLIHEYEIQHVVLGWPLRLNGKEGI